LYAGLSDDDKRRAFTMKEFKAVFGETHQRKELHRSIWGGQGKECGVMIGQPRDIG